MKKFNFAPSFFQFLLFLLKNYFKIKENQWQVVIN